MTPQPVREKVVMATTRKRRFMLFRVGPTKSPTKIQAAWLTRMREKLSR